MIQPLQSPESSRLMLSSLSLEFLRADITSSSATNIRGTLHYRHTWDETTTIEEGLYFEYGEAGYDHVDIASHLVVE